MRNLIKSAAASAIGALAMYYMDPERGHRRRALVRDRLDLASRDVGDFMHVQGRRAADQVRALRASARKPFLGASEAYPLRDQVRDEFDRLMRHPNALDKARASMAGMPRGTAMGSFFKVAVLCAASVAAMYYLDPDTGRRRRALVRDKFNSVSHGASDYARAKGKLAADRVKGMAASAGAPFAGLTQMRSDRQLRKRIRSELGRMVSHPKAVEVQVHHGQVSLHGHVLAAEADSLLSTVQALPGVQHVDNRLEVHEGAGSIPALQDGKQAAAARRAQEASVWH